MTSKHWTPDSDHHGRQQRHKDVMKKNGLTKRQLTEALLALGSHTSSRALTKREQEVLCITQLLLPDGDMNVLGLDQSAGRVPFCKAMSPCVTPGGRLWVTGSSPRLLSALETLALQGLGPAESQQFNLDSCPPRLLRSLSGNSFSAHVALAALMAGLACVNM